MIEIRSCGGFVTVQDLGWRTGRAMGLPPGGAVDPPSLTLANTLVGNEDGDAGLEIGLGAVVVGFDREGRVALTGGRARASISGAEVPADTTVPVRAGDELAIERISEGRFLYLAVDGGIAVDPLLGSRSTYLPTGLGGWQGRRLAAGDRLPQGDSAGWAPPPGTSAAEPPVTDQPIRIAPAPQLHLFDQPTRAALERRPFVVSPASDRMGSRLIGDPIRPNVSATHPSEATCPGAIQIPDGGQPIVLLADGPTVGGYPKIGAVIGADLARFAQTPLGREVRFEWVTVSEAQRARYLWTEALARRQSAIRATRIP